MTYRDIVFINTRLHKTKFKRALTIFAGIDSGGKSIPFAMSLLRRKDDEESYDYGCAQFKKVSGNADPKLFIIERNSKLKTSLHRAFPNTKVMYCPYHYLNCLISFFKLN